MTDMLLGVKCGCQVRQYTRLIQDDVRADGLAIVYCPKHATVDDILEALYQCFLWMKVNQENGPLSPDSDGYNRLLDKAEDVIDRATAQD